MIRAFLLFFAKTTKTRSLSMDTGNEHSQH